MFQALAGLLGGAGSSLAGGLLDFGLNYASAKAGRDWAGHQADAAMAFSERMASTQHQREVADLRAAGLNPILSASKGGPGAAAPGGVTMGAPSMPDVSTASSSVAMRRLVDQQRQTEHYRTETEKSNAEIARNRSDESEFEAAVSRALKRGFGSERAQGMSEGVEAEARRRLEDAKAGSTAASIERELDEASGELLRSLRRLGLSGGSAAQMLQLLRRPPVINRGPTNIYRR